jgi:hypothetical protein
VEEEQQLVVEVEVKVELEELFQSVRHTTLSINNVLGSEKMM